MFEKIVLRRSDSGLALTLGEVAEAMLFYQQVHLVLDPASLGSLINSFGAARLLDLIKAKRLTAVYAEDMLMAQQHNIRNVVHHEFVTGMLSGNQYGPPRKSRRERLEFVMEKHGHSRGESRRLVERFTDLIPIERYSGDYFVAGGVHRSATLELGDASYVNAAISRVLQSQVGFDEIAQDVRTEIVQAQGRFVLRSNVDFAKRNGIRKTLDSSLSAFTEGNLVVALLDASADLKIALLFDGDFYTSSINSEIIQIRFSELLRASENSASQIKQFNELVLPKYRTIREAINSKERSFDDFERVLEQSQEFRLTAHRMAADSQFVEEYFKESMSTGWISALPTREMRFVLGLAIDAANPIRGPSSAASNQAILAKLKSRRPSYFVDGILKPFLKK